MKEGLLDIPVLYLSSHIVRSEDYYYRLLQTVREKYLDALAEDGFVRKHRIGRGNYYINLAWKSSRGARVSREPTAAPAARCAE